MPERTRGGRRARIATLWIVTALLVGAYLALPSGDEGSAEEAAAGGSDAAASRTSWRSSTCRPRRRRPARR